MRATPFASTVPDDRPPQGWTVRPGTYRIDVARSAAAVETVLHHEVGETTRGELAPLRRDAV